MKRILALTLALWLFSATLALAGKIVSYNPSYGQPIRIVQTIYSGWNITRIVTVKLPNGCTVTTTTTYALWIQTGETVTTVCP